MTTTPRADDAPRGGRLSRRSGGPLDVDRARSRTSAFVYGNITVLGALAAVDGAMVEHGTAAVVVAVTALATLVAHVLADVVSAGIAPVQASTPQASIPQGHAGERLDEEGRTALAHEVRDAGPIASSGALPVAVLLLGTLGAISPTTAQLVATLVVVVRLAGVGFVVERLSGRRASFATFLTGVVLAAVSLAIAVVKAVLGH